MITRRNWLLRCSILINIAVLLYICSHVMIGSGNMALGPSYVIQDDYAKPQQQPIIRAVLQRESDGNNQEQDTNQVRFSFSNQSIF